MTHRTTAAPQSCLLTLIVSLLAAAPASANLRAPLELWRSPSSTLYRASSSLVAKGEDLRFTCSERACAVDATYHVEAARAARLSLEFICPGRNTLAVQVGARLLAPVRVKSVPLTAADKKKVAAGMGGRALGGLELHKARFEADVVQGKNRIRIRYTQQLSSMERGHSYSSNGRFVRHLQYELWPLKGWKLDPKFSLKLQVKLRRQAPSWWARTFGKVTSMACGKRGQGSAIIARPVQQGPYLVLAARLGSNFPDRLTCEFGHKDIIVM